ncbi:Protein ACCUMULATION AND REPLICATION OF CHLOROPLASTS 6, chloroplastic [Melia azedarach]|uniref:Protein ACCUMULATION AND REPLICATION OF CHLOROPLASTS 6, chloroplastic n=1 Tax=Melia azedarach TaxID=155640 RepID=A0ACC1WT45_MELAZ|nr:Protein ACCUMULATION AND REPLICATION OF CHLOROPLASTS 6, chloroplastic [Melia azedarach]
MSIRQEERRVFEYLPAWNISSLLSKEVGSAKTSDVITIGPLVDEKSGEELSRMDARLAKSIVGKWQEYQISGLWIWT